MSNTVSRRRNPLARIAAVLVAVFMLAPALPLAQTVDAQEIFRELREEQQQGVALTLREALTLALENNLAIAVRRYDPAMAENMILSERGIFDPTLTLFAQREESTNPSSQAFIAGATVLELERRVGGVRYEDPMSIGGKLTVELGAVRNANNSLQSNVNHAYNAALTFTYDQSLLRNFGYDVNTTGIRIAQRDLTISREAFRQVVIDTLLGTEKAYWDLKFAWEDLLVKKTSQRLSEETLRQNQIRVEVGTMAPIDVTTAEAEVAQRQVAVLQAENTLDNAQDMLRLYLNQPETAPVWVLDINAADEPPFDEELIIDLNAAIQEAVARRPDLSQMRLGIQNDEDTVKYARNQLRYDLGLRAQYGKTSLAGTFFDITQQPDPPIVGESDISDALSDLFTEDFDNWLVSVNFIIPFNNKAAKANYLNSRLGQDQRTGAYDSLMLDSAIEVRNRVRAVENAIQRVKAGRVNVRLQRERLAAENKRYENGMTTTFDLFRFQDELAQAASQVILAQVDYNKALVELDAAKGTLAEDRGVQEADLLAVEPPNPDLP